MNYVEIYRDTMEDGVSFVVEKGDDGSYRGCMKYADGSYDMLFQNPSADDTIAFILRQAKEVFSDEP
jgi:hypothetical protein